MRTHDARGVFGLILAFAPTLHGEYNVIDALTRLGIGKQGEAQRVIGPLQDDEALVLFSLACVSHVRRVLEVGGLLGDSARTFLAALQRKEGARMYTIDVNRVRVQDRVRHVVLRKDANQFTAADIGNEPVDLLFLDCHNYLVQQRLVQKVLSEGLLHPSGYIVLHDTGLHPKSHVRGSLPWPNASSQHWIHQPVERLLATWIAGAFPGWNRISFHDDDRRPFRHGLTVMQVTAPHEPMPLLLTASGGEMVAQECWTDFLPPFNVPPRACTAHHRPWGARQARCAESQPLLWASQWRQAAWTEKFCWNHLMNRVTSDMSVGP